MGNIINKLGDFYYKILQHIIVVGGSFKEKLTFSKQSKLSDYLKNTLGRLL